MSAQGKERDLLESNVPLDRLAQTVATPQRLFDVVVALVVVLGSFAAGLLTDMLPGVTSFKIASWTAASIGLASLCLGFGAATLVYRRSRAKQNEALRTAYDQLVARTDRLLDEMQSRDARR